MAIVIRSIPWTKSFMSLQQNRVFYYPQYEYKSNNSHFNHHDKKHNNQSVTRHRYLKKSMIINGQSLVSENSEKRWKINWIAHIIKWVDGWLKGLLNDLKSLFQQ